MNTVFEAIKAERERQIAKGFDAAHDDQHSKGELLSSVECIVNDVAYDRNDVGGSLGCAIKVRSSENTYKERLIIAAAMLIAEIERMERAEQ